MIVEQNLQSNARVCAEIGQRQALSLPTLPPEVLVIILSKLSVFDWSFADLDLLNPWNPFIIQSAWLEEQNRVNIATKRTLCLVSKHFYAMTMPWLYEHVWIRNPRALFTLAEPIILGQDSAGLQERLANYTRRLSICLGGNADASPGPIYIASSVLLRSCGENLTQLSISLLMKDGISIIHDVPMCTELRILRWRFMPLHCSLSVDLLSGIFNNLVVLDLTELATLPSAGMLKDVIDFPHLHTLRFSVCEIIEDFTRMVLPSIRVVDVEELPLRYDYDSRTASGAFIERHGFKLQTLIVRSNIPRVRLADAPDLQYLAIYLEGTGILDGEFTLRSLERIGILLPQSQVTGKHIISSIRSKVLSRQHDFPTLKSIETLRMTLPYYTERQICVDFPNSTE